MPDREDSPRRDEVSRLVIITLDSCRLDTAVLCRPRFLSSIADLQPARAQATFTLPAHVALFHGFPPITEDGAPRRNRSGVLSRLPTPGRWVEGSSTVMHAAQGESLIASLTTSGFKTVGAGGMRWFEPLTLRQHFSEFHFWHPRHNPDDDGLPAWADDDYALHHWRALSERVSSADRWLLFVNAAETHAPYMCTDSLLERQRQLASHRNRKRALPEDASTQMLMKDLHMAQVEALRRADERIRHLFLALPPPFHFLVTADHGEAFGEESSWGHVYGGAMVMHVPLWEGEYKSHRGVNDA